MNDPANQQLQPGRSRNLLKWFRRIALGAILLGVLTVSSGYLYYNSYLSFPGPSHDKTDIIVDIPQGTSVRGIRTILAEQNLIHDDFRFLVLAKVSGLGTKLQAGEFKLPTEEVPEKLLQILASAQPVHHSITIPEGLRITDIAQIFGEKGWCDQENFLKLSRETKYLDGLKVGTIKNLEGFLFPDTYLLTKEMRGADKIITMMVSRFKEVWKELEQAKLADGNVNDDLLQTVILASIVEKETGAASERPLIAGVFHNRIRTGMKLQSDPTVIYGIENFSGNITKKDLRTPSPYNTYTLKGLPVGPICNPGKDALRAVLQPQQTKYLYFVSKNDGTHQFSSTLAEHNRAVRKYQRKKNPKKGK